VQASGIEGEHLDALVQLPGDIQQYHVFGATEGDPQVIAEQIEGELKNVLRRFLGVGCSQRGDVDGGAHQAASL